MMTSEHTTKKWQATGAKAVLPRRRFRFLFDLEGGDVFGKDFECTAHTQQGALDALEKLIPGASIHIKTIKVVH